MKKILCIAMTLLFMFLLCSGAMAAPGGLYTIHDAGMSIEVPKDMMALTRDVAENDTDLDKISMTRA